MNKRIIVLIVLMVAVFAVPASAETLEVRGTIVELDAAYPTLTVNTPSGDWYSGYRWDYSTFAGFWYDADDDLKTEEMTILSGLVVGDTVGPLDFATQQRTIGEGRLMYTTHPVFQEYELHENEAGPDRTTQTAMEAAYDDLLDQPIGLCVDSDNPGGDCGYFLEGWMGEAYVAIDDNADKLCKPLVVFEDDDKKTLVVGEEWDLGGGFALEVTGIDGTGEKATVQLSKNGGLLATGTLDTSGSEQDHVYTYTADIGGEDDIPVFSCYVDAIFSGTDTVEIMYVFLIDDDVLEIETSDTYGAMEVMTASRSSVVLRNDETTIDLDIDSTEQIMGSMYFKTADDESMPPLIRFYPYVEYTEPGTYEVRGNIAELDGINPILIANTPVGDPYPGYRWDYSSFAGFWYDMDDDLKTEGMTILSGAVVGDTVGPVSYPNQRTIGEGRLVYTTSPVFQEYEMHQDIASYRVTPSPMELAHAAVLEQPIGLCVESDNPQGDCGYFIEGWMGEKYVAIDDNAAKLTRLLVEFEDDDTETLYVGDEWNLSGGFAFELLGIDDTGKKATLRLSKNGAPLEGGLKCIDTGSVDKQDCVYTYTADIGGEEDIPVFSCYVGAVFKGSTSYVQLMYAFLIDDDVLEIETSDTYGAMEVMTASKSGVVLRNDETTLDLDEDTTEHIMGDMYFMTTDDESTPPKIRFYPFVERTIGGEDPTPQPSTCNITDTDHDGVPDAWDEEADTPAGYWVNSDGIGRKWGDMNGDGELTSVDALMILQAAVGGASAQSIAIKAGDGSDLPDSIPVDETFTVLITENGSHVGAGTNVVFTLPYGTGDPVLRSTDDDGKVNYKPPITGTLGIRVLDGLVRVAEANVTVTTTGIQTLGSVVISPDSADLSIDETQRFTATCYDTSDNLMSSGYALTWNCDTDAVGTIDSSGLFTAGGVGTATVTVTATQGYVTKTDTAIVTVSALPVMVPVDGIDLPETSVPAGTAADITVNGTFDSSVTGSIDMTAVPNPEATVGSYAFTCYDEALMGLTVMPDAAIAAELADGNGTIRIEICYNATELASKDISPSTLAIYRYDVAAAVWKKMVAGIDPCVANGITGTCAWIKVDNLSTFALVGTKTAAPSGGGGGGGTYPPGWGYTINDTDGDGVPDVWDADNSTPAGYWVNSDGIGRMWGDMNGDGKLTSVDALMILQAAVGKIDL